MARKFCVAALDLASDRSGFRSGVEPLDQYFRAQVSQDIKRRVTACFVATNAHGQIAAYYTLASASVLLADLPEALAKKLPRYPPGSHGGQSLCLLQSLCGRLYKHRPHVHSLSDVGRNSDGAVFLEIVLGHAGVHFPRHCRVVFVLPPPRQTSCRSDMMLILGAIRTNDGSVWRSIQKQSGGAVVAAGERQRWRSSL